jgi:hypothetical protein
VLVTTSLAISQNGSYLLVAKGAAGGPVTEVNANELPSDLADPGTARLLFLNLLPDAGPFALGVNSVIVGVPIAFGKVSAPVAVEPGEADVQAYASATVYEEHSAKLKLGKTYLVTLIGTDDSGDELEPEITVQELK